MKEKIRKILEPLMNLPTEFAEEKYIGETCLICGFPFSKEKREKIVDQATDQIIEEIKKVLLNELEMIKIADVSLGYNGLGTKMTTKEIHKIFKAIYTAQKKRLKKGRRDEVFIVR